MWHKPWLSLGLGMLVLAPAWAQAACPDLFFAGHEPAIADGGLQQRTTKVCYSEYALEESGLTRDPLWSAEHLTAEQIETAKTVPRTGDFHADPNVPAADRSELADYKHSAYDRGHMTPAGDADSSAAKGETFSLANIVPQTAQLNRGSWERIETKVRGLATQLGEIYVVTGPLFEDENITTIGEDDVAVPTSTWKAVYEPETGAAAYVCTNTDQPTCQVVSIADLAQRSGIDPFPTLSAGVKARPIELPQP